jgi:hypothetical protein
MSSSSRQMVVVSLEVRLPHTHREAMQSDQATTKQKEGMTAWKKKIIIAYNTSVLEASM